MSESRQRDQASQALSSAALTQDLVAGNKALQILEVRLKASVNITETVTVSKIGSDTNHTSIEDTSALSGAQNYVFRPDGELIINAGDTLRLACTNANTTGTVYGEIVYKEANG